MRPPLRRPLSCRARAEIVLEEGGAGVNLTWGMSFTSWGLSLLPVAPEPRSQAPLHSSHTLCGL